LGLIGGSFMTGRGRWAVTGAVMIAIGICLLAAGHVSRPGSEAMTELDEIVWPAPRRSVCDPRRDQRER